MGISCEYDVIIIGGGPAGLTAGIYASRARLKTLLIESYSIPTQVFLTNSIENYPGFPEGITGIELIAKFSDQARISGLEFTVGNVLSIVGTPLQWQVTIEDRVYNTLSLIIASGNTHKKLGVWGESAFCGKGVSYCATCDAPFFRDKEIVVVGGGDAAVEEALFLTKFGKKVTLIHRRDKLRATKILQERIFANEKMAFIWNCIITKILGSNKEVSGVRIKDVNSQKEGVIPCQGIFIFIGLIPNTKFLEGVINLDEEGYVITDEFMNTSKEGIFAAGDCRKKMVRQIVTACGDGAIAASSAQMYIATCAVGLNE